MKTTGNMIHPLLERMGRIERMERGAICRMTGRAHYNHQTWQAGRNVVRYVPAAEVPALQKAMDGYRLFMALAERYADEIIQRTRRERTKRLAREPRSRPKMKGIAAMPPQTPTAV